MSPEAQVVLVKATLHQLAASACTEGRWLQAQVKQEQRGQQALSAELCLLLERAIGCSEVPGLHLALLLLLGHLLQVLGKCWKSDLQLAAAQ